MRGRASLAALLLFGLAFGGALPAAAAAFHPDQLELQRAIQAGDEFWGPKHNQCFGENRGTIDKTFPASHANAAAYSFMGMCGTIHVLRSRAEQYTRSQFCVVVVHEYGHTINHPHVADPRNIMYPMPVTAGFHTKACDYPDPHRLLADRTAAAQTPQTPSPPALHPLPLPKSFEIVAPPLVEQWR